MRRPAFIALAAAFLGAAAVRADAQTNFTTYVSVGDSLASGFDSPTAISFFAPAGSAANSERRSFRVAVNSASSFTSGRRADRPSCRRCSTRAGVRCC